MIISEKTWLFPREKLFLTDIRSCWAKLNSKRLRFSYLLFSLLNNSRYMSEATSYSGRCRLSGWSSRSSWSRWSSWSCWSSWPSGPRGPSGPSWWVWVGEIFFSFYFIFYYFFLFYLLLFFPVCNCKRIGNRRRKKANWQGRKQGKETARGEKKGKGEGNI